MNHEIEIKLKQLLKKSNMTQQELCNKTGLGGRTISVLVNNKIERVPKKALSKIADVFELDDIRDLIDFKKE
ncbi:helix-turn-helix domain-containing protein [Rummeliibacillus pycnus]|uniref:helix-turn-helix domain-containing protein n=1 Tax=Rummeliibacillus pycnus TaxID=101070 RepID=UPI000C9C1283|nr:helix-turn-helix transcriptional regulator [Rummeliibacillus pycnus]